jgi:two-component system, NtrC family, sensor kinase
MDEKIRILLVDDEISIQKAFRRLFMDSEFEILSASSSQEGLAVLSQNHPIQVVISDYGMPGMNGVDFLKEVCTRWPETMRIILSGYEETPYITSAMNSGEIYKYNPKPWNDDELVAIIEKALEQYLRNK